MSGRSNKYNYIQGYNAANPCGHMVFRPIKYWDSRFKFHSGGGGVSIFFQVVL
jgi:hypothetical protein